MDAWLMDMETLKRGLSSIRIPLRCTSCTLAPEHSAAETSPHSFDQVTFDFGLKEDRFLYHVQISKSIPMSSRA
jgi:hypothetical protein